MLHVTDRLAQPEVMQPGRRCNTAVNPKVPEDQAGLMAGFAEFSYKYGVMDIHYHGNEYMYVVEAHNALIRHGMDLGNLVTETLHAGEIVRPVDGEWHRFDFTTPDGYVLFLNFFPNMNIKVVNSADLNKK